MKLDHRLTACGVMIWLTAPGAAWAQTGQASSTLTLPARVLPSAIDGVVVVRCQADGRGGLQGCGVSEERPSGHAFGAQAYADARGLRIAPEAAAAGDWVRIPYVFSHQGAPANE